MIRGGAVIYEGVLGSVQWFWMRVKFRWRVALRAMIRDGALRSVGTLCSALWFEEGRGGAAFRSVKMSKAVCCVKKESMLSSLYWLGRYSEFRGHAKLLEVLLGRCGGGFLVFSAEGKLTLVKWYEIQIS
jgi:hypothetical protein